MPTISLEMWGIIIGVVALVIGIPAFIFALPQISGSVSALWARKRVAIFGPQAVGKTTLLKYLRGEAMPRMHVPTIGASVAGRIALDLKGDRTVYFVARVIDVGGEFRQQWAPVIRNYNPHGIIYILDTSNPEIERAGLEHLFNTYKTMSEEMLNRDIRLRAISIFLNKADLWGGANIVFEQKQISEYQRFLAPITSRLESLLGVTIAYTCTSFPHVRYREANNQGLRDFSYNMAQARPR